MSRFMAAQPEAARARLAEILDSDHVPMATLFYADFVTAPLAISNRRVAFTDARWSRTWLPGDGLLVGLPRFSTSKSQLNTFREYRLGFPERLVPKAQELPGLVQYIGDRAEYADREVSLWSQVFDPETDQPVGWPFAHDVGFMDRMTLSVARDMIVVALTGESALARHGTPPYGSQTYRDQKRRYPTDEGMEFTSESKKVITWTQF